LNDGSIVQIDTFETLPNNRYIYGCGDNNGNARDIYFFRAMSVNNAIPDESINP